MNLADILPAAGTNLAHDEHRARYIYIYRAYICINVYICYMYIHIKAIYIIYIVVCQNISNFLPTWIRYYMGRGLGQLRGGGEGRGEGVRGQCPRGFRSLCDT